MTELNTKALLQSVVDALMTNAWGQQAWRLQLRGKRAEDVHVLGAEETDLGGRNRASVTECLQPFIDRIETLETELAGERQAHAKTKAELKSEKWDHHRAVCDADDRIHALTERVVTATQQLEQKVNALRDTVQSRDAWHRKYDRVIVEMNRAIAESEMAGHDADALQVRAERAEAIVRGLRDELQHTLSRMRTLNLNAIDAGRMDAYGAMLAKLDELEAR